MLFSTRSHTNGRGSLGTIECSQEDDTGKPSFNGLALRHAELLEIAAQYKANVFLFGKTHLKPDKRFWLSNYVFYWNNTLGHTVGGTAIVVRCLFDIFCL